MLIVPAENRPDWSRPPVATLALILLNCLVFFLYQTGDFHRMADAVEAYQELGLAEREATAYRQWLDSGDAGLAEQVEEFQEETGQALGDEFLLQMAVFDRDFDHWLRADASAGFAEDEQWQWRRESFEERRDRVSFIAHGLIPAEFRLSGLFTSMFLHGDEWHLLGNMAFLFLFGFTLEAALGRARLVGLYLVCGVAAGLSHMIAEWGSAMPVVGASGAVSGLMGMYLALYGLRRITFFYWIGFYFNYFRAPALLMLPVWLGKEILEALFTNAPVAYWAHAGGMATGYVLLAAWLHRGLAVDREGLGDRPATNAAPHPEYAKLVSLVQSMELDRARVLAETLFDQVPEDVDVAEQYARLLRIQASNVQIEAFVRKVSRIPGMDTRVLDLCEAALALHEQNRNTARPLDGDTARRLLDKLVWGRRYRASLQLVSNQIRGGQGRRLDPDTLVRLAVGLDENGQADRAGKIRKLAEQLGSKPDPAL